MRFQAVTQIILVVISLVIVFTIIRPMFADIRGNQDEITRFREALDTVGQYNARLGELQQRARSFNTADIEALYLYVPVAVDTLSVSRDIQRIAAMNQIIVESITPITDDAPAADGEQMVEIIDPETGLPVGEETRSLAVEAHAGLVSGQFTLAGYGTYEQITAMLADFERNVYPLRLIKLDVTADATAAVYGITAVLETYALPQE